MEQGELRNTEREWIVAGVAMDSFAHDVEMPRTLRAVQSVLTDRERDAKALGWDRAHTTMCGKTQCRSHTNPWVRSRG